MSSSLETSMSLGSVTEAISSTLGIRIAFAVASSPLEFVDLDAEEKEVAASFTSRMQRRWYLTGRAALRMLLSRMGRSLETSSIEFPHPTISLSHAGDIALAVGLAEYAPSILGLGVDLELVRSPTVVAPRIFLTEEERAWLARKPAEERNNELARLWTVKGSVFKADPRNAATALYDYTVESPELMNGFAERRGLSGGQRFVYATHSVAGGVLTVGTLRQEC